MTCKDIAVDLISKLPDEATLTDIAQEIEFVAGIRRGAEELDRGEGVPAEEVFKLIPTWAQRTR
jgi:predicted transcriptional regulator